MEKLTQEIITKESVKDSLLTLSGGDKKLSLYLGAITAFFALPLIFLSGGSAIRAITQGAGPLEIVANIALVLLFVALPSVPLIPYFVSHKRIRKIKNGEFSVKVDRVTYMTEKYKYRGKHTYLARIFEFRDCGEVEVDSIKYSYTSHGDEFYLVFIDGENKPALAYACKIHDYKE